MKDGKHVILIVDDDPDMIKGMEIVLNKGGYLVVQAMTAEEGLRKYEQESPDLLIIDLMMEEVDAGTNMVKELKARGNTKPVYMLSSVGDALNSNVDAAGLGLTGVFQKPPRPNVLLKTLKSKLK